VTATYRFTPALLVGGAYIYNAGKADYEGLKPTFQQINLGANYSLSKRTSLFAVAVFQKAGGDGISASIQLGGR